MSTRRVVRRKRIVHKKKAKPHRQSYYKGRGKYTPVNKKGKTKKVTQDVTSGIVSEARNIGGSIGAMLGHGIDYFFGRGEYSVKENQLLDEVSGVLPPVKNNDKVGVVFRRSEYITDIFSSGTTGAFQNNNFFVNPGLAATFEWMSQVAANFEEYVIDGLYFEFRSMSSDSLNSTNTALGSVIMAAQYNAALPNFTNKQEMENYEGGVSCKPSCNMRYFLECARNQTVLSDLYVRTGAVPSGLDQRFYDLANFQIATVGMQAANVNLGELWVSYQISLRKPKLFTDLGLTNLFNNEQTSTGVSQTAPLGTSGWTGGAYSQANDLSLIYAPTSITFPYTPIPQTFLWELHWAGNAGVTGGFPTVTYGTGCTGATINSAGTGVLAGNMNLTGYIGIPGDNLEINNLLFVAPTGFTGPTSVTMSSYITQVPNLVSGL